MTNHPPPRAPLQFLDGPHNPHPHPPAVVAFPKIATLPPDTAG